MTPQERAIADLLQVSLFKLGEQYHGTLARLKARHPHRTEELNDIARDVEKMIDDTLEDYRDNKGDFSMRDVDRINRQVVEARKLLGP